MAVSHKFKQIDFGNGFTTSDAILSGTPFEPEVLFLGTFNPRTNEQDNMADFFYGRNWLWPSMFNIFINQNIFFTTQRKFTNPLNPSLKQILNFCDTYKITFADLISEVLPNEIEINELVNNTLVFNGLEYNLISDKDLARLDRINQVTWTTQNIINYLENTPSISTVYFTRKPVQPFTAHWNTIINHNFGREILFKKIFTPSGQGLEGSPRINHLINHWLYNNNQDYNRIDIEWLRRHNVNPEIFINP